MHALLIHNPTAGAKDSSSDHLADLLEKAGYDVVIQSPKESAYVARIRQGADLVVAAGGDGTVTQVALDLAAGALLGIIPLGTANNIANSLGIRGRPEDIIAGLPAATRRNIDVWSAKGPWGDCRFIEGCGIGALTRAAHQMDDLDISSDDPEHQISVARAALLKTLGQNEPVAARMTLDDAVLEGNFLLLEMLNFAAVGPRLALAWSADPSDGLLDIGYALEDSYNDLCEWLSDGGRSGAAPVKLRRSRVVHLTWQNARFRIGDEYWPETGMPEPRASYDATLRLASQGPTILIPQAPP